MRYAKAQVGGAIRLLLLKRISYLPCERPDVLRIILQPVLSKEIGQVFMSVTNYCVVGGVFNLSCGGR